MGTAVGWRNGPGAAREQGCGVAAGKLAWARAGSPPPCPAGVATGGASPTRCSSVYPKQHEHHTTHAEKESQHVGVAMRAGGTRKEDLGELHESVVAGHGVRLRPAVVVMEKRARAVVLLLDGERGRAASPRGGKKRQLPGALVATVRVVVGGVPVRVVAAPVALPTTASNDG